MNDADRELFGRLVALMKEMEDQGFFFGCEEYAIKGPPTIDEECKEVGFTWDNGFERYEE